MKVTFTKAFKKDLLKIADVDTKRKLKNVILHLEEAPSFQKISNCTKMKGHPTAYRIRVGNYRLGTFVIKNEVQIARFVKRNDIYKLFP